MGNIRRTEPSKDNDYWMPGPRHLELLYFCRQYPEWKQDLIRMNGYNPQCAYHNTGLCSTYLNPTEDTAVARQMVQERIDLIDITAKEAAGEYAKYLLDNIINRKTYENMSLMGELNISEYKFRQMYRKFFWLLSIKRK